MPDASLAEAIDAVLPQTQCTRCGFADCRAYADAIAADEAPIDRCPPGGDSTIAALAVLTRRAVVPLDTRCGDHQAPAVARVDEAACIGCTLCIAACPVDAIIGAQKRMHTVLTSLCSGCELCIPPCPVDCIEMIPAARAWTALDADAARARHQARAARQVRTERQGQRNAAVGDHARRMASVASALARARARRTPS